MNDVILHHEMVYPSIITFIFIGYGSFFYHPFWWSPTWTSEVWTRIPWTMQASSSTNGVGKSRWMKMVKTSESVDAWTRWTSPLRSRNQKFKARRSNQPKGDSTNPHNPKQWWFDQSKWFSIRPRKQTWQWKSNHWEMYFPLKIGLFHCQC